METGKELGFGWCMFSLLKFGGIGLFTRLAYTTLKRKEFSGLLEKVKYFLLTFCANRFFENIHQSGPRNWEKAVICVPIYTTEQSDHRLKQVKTYLRLLRKADIQIRANSIGKD